MFKRVVVVANKSWECDPILNVLLSPYVRLGSDLGWPRFLNHPRRRQAPGRTTWPLPRALFALAGGAVEIWCLADLLEHLPELPKFQSSSERKAEVLPALFAGQKPDLVIAIGTAACLAEVSENGNVVVGTRVFLHNADPDNPDSRWNQGPFDAVIDSALSQAEFRSIATFDAAVCDHFLTAPCRPASDRKLMADYNGVALGSLNVTNPEKFGQADRDTYRLYAAHFDPAWAASLETTHGLIRVLAEAPFLFVSGVANRAYHYAEDVAQRPYAQNTVAAHNAGVVLARLLNNQARLAGAAPE